MAKWKLEGFCIQPGLGANMTQTNQPNSRRAESRRYCEDLHNTAARLQLIAAIPSQRPLPRH
jgi:hypothetical protein